MFTGIVEARGKIRTIRKTKKAGTALVEILVPRIFTQLKKGASLAIEGVCLTVVKKTQKSLFFHIVQETKKRSTLGALREGGEVNLERPLKAQSRVEGHFVLGHVDGVGEVKKIASLDKERSFFISLPKNIRQQVLSKGSITVNGVSLTVGRLSKAGFWVHCIPHTLKTTTLQGLVLGDRVNLEADILLKLAERVFRSR